MKRKTAVFAAVLCALAAAFVVLGGCAEEEGTALSGSMTLVFDSKDTQETDALFEVDLSAYTDQDSPMDVLSDLVKEGKACYEGGGGLYGTYLTAVGPIAETADENGQTVKTENFILRQDASAGIYLYIYTNVAADQADYEGMSTVEYEGQTLVESAKGIGGMHLQDGAVVYLTTIVYGA